MTNFRRRKCDVYIKKANEIYLTFRNFDLPTKDTKYTKFLQIPQIPGTPYLISDSVVEKWLMGKTGVKPSKFILKENARNGR